LANPLIEPTISLLETSDSPKEWAIPLEEIDVSLPESGCKGEKYLFLSKKWIIQGEK